MGKLKLLLEKSKCGYTIFINPHKDSNETVEQAMGDISLFDDGASSITQRTYDLMISNDSIINICFYVKETDTNYSVYHYDFEQAIEVVLDLLSN